MLLRPKSTVSLRNTNFKFNFTNNTNLNKFNNKSNVDIFQSPKLYSGKMRYILEDKKLFSLLDLNEKITNSKGPSLPIQFKRLTSDEIHDFFNGNKTKIYEKIKKLKYTAMKDKILNRIKIPNAINKEPYILHKESKNKKVSNTIEVNKTENTIKKYTIDAEPRIEKKLDNKKEEILKRPSTSILSYKQKIRSFINNNEDEKNEIKEKKRIINKNDIWMPKNYKEFEETVKDRKVFFQKMKENPFFSRLPTCTLKEIQSKSYNTDIFFIKPPKQNSKFNSYKNYMKNFRNQKINPYYNSDIFNIKNDETSIKKIGEKYLFYIPQDIKYTSSRESNSEWKSHIREKSINNCSSKDYNILTPNRRNENLMKEKVYKTLDETNYSKDNPISKPRSVSKFIDLAKNSSSNFGEDYMFCYQTNPDCFKKVPEYCSSFGDLFLQYKNLCDRPFYKKSIFTIEKDNK